MMNSFSFFLNAALCLAMATMAQADDADPDAPSRAGLAIACAEGMSGPATGRARPRFSYALLHEGSGLTMFGFPFSGRFEGAAMEAIGPSLWRGGAVDAVALPLGRTAKSCCGDDPETADSGMCAGRIGRPGDGIDVADMLENVAARDATVSILRTFDGDALRLETPEGPRMFAIPALYVARGILRYRDRVSDTELGRIVAIAR